MTEKWQGTRRITLTAVCFATGVVWLAAVLWVVVGNVIIRETALGSVALQFDRLPLLLAKPILVLCWCLFFLGWAIPLVVSVRRIFRRVGKCICE